MQGKKKKATRSIGITSRSNAANQRLPYLRGGTPRHGGVGGRSRARAQRISQSAGAHTLGAGPDAAVGGAGFLLRASTAGGDTRCGACWRDQGKQLAPRAVHT